MTEPDPYTKDKLLYKMRWLIRFMYQNGWIEDNEFGWPDGVSVYGLEEDE